MRNLVRKSIVLIAVSCCMVMNVDAQTNGNAGTFETASGNSYLYHQYGDLYWMVSNSREGDPVNKTWGIETADPKAEGENGFYYLGKEKEMACPDGWRLPTRAEGDALMTLIKSDKEAPAARWWTKAEDNAFAGAIRNGGISAGWEAYGVWRLADGLNEDNGEENWKFFTMTIDPQKDKWYTEIGSSKGHAYTIRCVKNGGGTAISESKTLPQWNAYITANYLFVENIGADDIGKEIHLFSSQGIELLKAEINSSSIQLPVKLASGVYVIMVAGNVMKLVK